MNGLLAAALLGFGLGAAFGVLAHRRWVLLELGETMIRLGRDRGGPDFEGDDQVEQDNSSSWPEIPLGERRGISVE